MKSSSKSRTYIQTIFWGLITIAAYLLVFLNQQTVMDYTTRGGSFALLVIVMALAFSFVHGAFANYLIDAMGFKAAKKK